MNQFSKAILAQTFREICQGYSEGVFEGKKFYFKHFNSSDLAYLDEIYEQELEIAISRGFPRIKDREQSIIVSGLWPDSKIRQIETLKNHKEMAELGLQRAKNEFQITQGKEIIESYIKELDKLENERLALIGPTAEKEANRYANEATIQKNLFKDRELKSPLFEDDDYEYLEREWKERFLSYFWEKIMGRFNREVLKRISYATYFFRPFSFSEDKFFGERGADLTSWQMDMINYGHKSKDTLQHCYGKKIPEEYWEEPDKLEAWVADIKANNGKERVDPEEQAKKVAAQFPR